MMPTGTKKRGAGVWGPQAPTGARGTARPTPTHPQPKNNPGVQRAKNYFTEPAITPCTKCR